MSGSGVRRSLRRARVWLGVFVAGLVLSGLTAFPLAWEVARLDQWAGPGSAVGGVLPDLAVWVRAVRVAVDETATLHPFLAYATDWLAFAHLVIAVAFVGALRDPLRNLWVVEFGLLACGLVIPFALVCGSLRGVPLFWRIVDCSFGVLGALPLLVAHQAIRNASRSTAGAVGSVANAA